MPTFRVVKLDEDAIVPTKAHADDAGLDLYSLYDVKLWPGDTRLVGTGIAIEVPRSFAGFVLPRSGLALKHGVTVQNSPGLIDCGYRGDVGVILHNTSHENSYNVVKGDRIAQLIIAPVPNFVPVLVDKLRETQRQEKGFGDSGN